MTTLIKTQYELAWLGTLGTYTMDFPNRMLADSEQELWSELDRYILNGWEVISTEMVVHN